MDKKDFKFNGSDDNNERGIYYFIVTGESQEILTERYNDSQSICVVRATYALPSGNCAVVKSYPAGIYPHDKFIEEVEDDELAEILAELLWELFRIV